MLLGCLFIDDSKNSSITIIIIAVTLLTGLLIYEINNRLRIVYIILSLLLFVSGFLMGSIRYNHYLRDRDYYDRIEDGQVVRFQGELAKKEKKTTSYYLYFNNIIMEDIVLDSSETILLQSDSDDLPIGNTVVVEGKKENWNYARNEGNFDEKSYYNSIGTLMKVKGDISVVEEPLTGVMELLYSFRENVKEAYLSNLPNEEGGIVSAMTLGDKSELDTQVKDLFKLSGLAHILAISGLHISIVGMSIYRLMRKRGTPFAVAGVVSSTLVILYGMLTFGGVSTIRAVVMFLLMILGDIIGEGYDSLSAIGAALIYVLIMHPYSINSAGFIFSFGAVTGIAVVVNPLTTLYDKYCRLRFLYVGRAHSRIPFVKEKLRDSNKQYKASVKERIFKALLSGVLIQLVTIPIVCLYYYEIPTYVVILNLLVIPLLGVLLSASIIGGMTIVVSSELTGVLVVGGLLDCIGNILLWIAHIIVYLYEMLSYISLQLPVSRIITGSPNVVKVIIYYVVLFTVTRYLVYKYEDMEKLFEIKCDTNTRYERRDIKSKIVRYLHDKRSLIACVAVLSVSILFITNNRDYSDFEMDVIDVGQGDGIYIAGDNNYFFDGGSTDIKNVGTYRILPFLKYKGVRHIDYWFVSHVDSDHISGLLEALDSGYSISNIVVDKYMLSEDNYKDIEIRANNNNVNIVVMETGDVVAEDNLRFTCIFAGVDKIGDINGNSLVLLGEYANGEDTTTMLIGGDMTADSEKCVIDSMSDGSLDSVRSALLDVDILKVSHHGSKTSSSEEFIKTISPEMALISAGVNNRYNHPSPEVIERLDKMNIPHLCTIECGRLKVNLDDKSVKIYYNG